MNHSQIKFSPNPSIFPSQINPKLAERGFGVGAGVRVRNRVRVKVRVKVRVRVRPGPCHIQRWSAIVGCCYC